MNPRMIDLFSGCGGLSHGFIKAGYDVVAFVEWWTPAVTTFLKNHPQAEHLGTDISAIKNDVLLKYKNKVEIIAGGPPCQGFSIAGKRNPEDYRNQLYKEFLRFVEVIEPKTVVIENVVGLLSMNDYDNEKIINKILHKLIELDYFVSYKILKASNYGVPQDRRRIIIIAQKLDLYPEPTIKGKTVIESISNIQKNINANENFKVTNYILEKIKTLKQGEGISKKFNFCRRRLIANKPSRTIPTKVLYIHPYEDRFLTPRELARLQSFPDNFYFYGSKTDMVKQIGNAVPPLLAEAIAKKLIGGTKNE